MSRVYFVKTGTARVCFERMKTRVTQSHHLQKLGVQTAICRRHHPNSSETATEATTASQNLQNQPKQHPQLRSSIRFIDRGHIWPEKAWKPRRRRVVSRNLATHTRLQQHTLTHETALFYTIFVIESSIFTQNVSN